MVMPGVPASPKNRAHSDQPKAASTPTEIRVSMVAAPWRRLAHAARWNGQAPQMATGAARVSDSHCQLSNCSAGTMAMATTGTVSAAETISRGAARSAAGRLASRRHRPLPAGAGRPALRQRWAP